MENIVLVNRLVRESHKSNAEGLRIPLQTKINIAYIKAFCKNTVHEKIVKFLEFGWPLGHDGRTIPPEPKRNHKGVREYPQQTWEYLQAEKQKNRVLGPCQSKVFAGKNGISPLNSVPRKQDDKRRFVLDLSFPRGRGINSGIDKDRYQGEEVKLKYPTVDDLVDLIFQRKNEDPQAKILLWKRDLKACYRQFQLCPGSIHLVGYKFADQYWYDLVLAMGSSSSAQICQKITDMIRYVFENRYDDEVRNFLDDFFSAQIAHKAEQSFLNMAKLLEVLGIEEGQDKACSPDTSMVVLGILFNTVTMTMSLTPQKMDEIIQELKKWKNKQKCSLRQMQSLIGKLNFAAGVVRSGRVYMSRLINTLRQRKSNSNTSIVLTEDNLNDVKWWLEHIDMRNGVPMESLMTRKKWENQGFDWSSDSSGTGMGGWSGNSGLFYHCAIPPKFRGLDINSLECFALLLCVRKWNAQCQGKRIIINCDNMTTVSVINSGAAKCPFLQACLREIHHICALNSTEIRAKWVGTEQNSIADVLSRWDKHPKYRSQFEELTKGCQTQETKIQQTDWEFHYTSF